MKDSTAHNRQVLTEEQVKALRDKVFGHVSSDRNWQGCKENWMRPESVKWLMEQAMRMDSKPKQSSLDS